MVTRIGLVTVSDRASSGVYEDKGGPALQEFLADCITSEYHVISRVIPDVVDTISATLIDLIDNEGCSLVITTGGTGPSPRDVTPEATEEVCDRMLPGFGELMRQVSLQVVSTAILSRQTAGTRGSGLIINVPGKPSAIADCLQAVMPAIPYCIDLIGGERFDLIESMASLRPPNS
jgi:molybdopterin adenylyltransferase